MRLSEPQVSKRDKEEAQVKIKIEQYVLRDIPVKDESKRPEIEKMLHNGYEILITQVASDGLVQWLGKRISKENFTQFKKDSVKYGFHVGGEGGYFDTLVTDAPIFKKKLLVEGIKATIEDNYCGHVEITKYKITDKINQPIMH